MNATAQLRNMVLVAGVAQRFAAGPDAAWVQTPKGADWEAAVARTAANGAFPPVPTPEEQAAAIMVGSPEWEELTKRRAALIDKMYNPGQGLTEEEQAEFERLQQRSRRAIETTFPRPRLAHDELAALKQALGISENAGGP